ncbi:LacI family DNA-binding transcriptional regulator [Micromonospora sp. WMMD812]|uniref:LacI family DNA-binding transcriptional regulator n=1 Tax=Micromonospora sp. WMMD812 TaxID=3015152 RepID=UPI00248D0480|nr:LacI family DNA-binding transcriptional regulator [Micromonospora sp. WMMD812]WBB69221.1 LacI family DNA-binding transcriptional regulator [Micromonospora sp. WMMD812]
MARKPEDGGGGSPQEAAPRRRQRQRPTIQDLARAAGTSPSTASRALSGNGYVAAEVSARVLAAAEQIGYVPDGNARALRNRTSRAVGVLISDIRNPFYANLAAGIEEQLRAAGYHVIVVNNDGQAEAEVEGARTFLAVRVSAAIVTPVSGRAVRMLMDDGVTVVQADRMVDGLTSDGVLVDNVQGAQEITSHLVDLGHTNIALLIDETDWTTGAGRLAGFRAALRAARLPMDPTLVVPTRFQPDAARDAVNALLDRRPDVTALFAANNMLAEGAFQALQGRGLRVPDDLSLVAFDDVPWMSMVSPGITTVDQHTDDLGRTCAQLVIDRLGGSAPNLATVQYIEPSVVIRGSTAAPRSVRIHPAGSGSRSVTTAPSPR